MRNFYFYDFLRIGNFKNQKSFFSFVQNFGSTNFWRIPFLVQQLKVQQLKVQPIIIVFIWKLGNTL